MATGGKVHTRFQENQHTCDMAAMRAAGHGFWPGAKVFNGVRHFASAAPDLDANCSCASHSAAAPMIQPIVGIKETTGIIWEGLKLCPKEAAVYIRPMYWAHS